MGCDNGVMMLSSFSTEGGGVLVLANIAIVWRA